MIAKAPGKPVGASAVSAALIRAAADLFAKRGIAAVSVREIAAHAGVNHGLVHRYFGSKDGLLAAVMQHVRAEVADDARRLVKSSRIWPSAFRASRRQDTMWRILGHLVLEGYDLTVLMGNFPVITAVVALVRESQKREALDPGLDAQAMTAVAVALSLGWLTFEPFLLSASGLDQLPPFRRQREVLRVVHRLMRSISAANAPSKQVRVWV